MRGSAGDVLGPPLRSSRAACAAMALEAGMRMGRATMDAYSARRNGDGSDSPALMPRLLCTNSSTVILRFTCAAAACC